uniref:C2H2-type domain-containing protein n=1 Tax=Phlebotomus papatasi TaxID=29031 RepID=A0A1B0D7Q9_PHLPP
MESYSLKHRIFLVKQFYQELGNYACVKDNYEDYYGKTKDSPEFSKDVLIKIIWLFEQTGSVCNQSDKSLPEPKIQNPNLQKNPPQRKSGSTTPIPFGTSYECEMCSKDFLNHNNLKYHILQSHELEDIFKCDICSVDCRTRFRYIEHMRSHGNATPFSSFGPLTKIKQCEYCGKFISNSIYDKHRQIHSKEYSVYQCNICGKSYTWECGLKLHMVMHNINLNTYVYPTCEICGLKMGGERTLKLHMEKAHSSIINERNFQEMNIKAGPNKENRAQSIDIPSHPNAVNDTIDSIKLENTVEILTSEDISMNNLSESENFGNFHNLSNMSETVEPNSGSMFKTLKTTDAEIDSLIDGALNTPDTSEAFANERNEGSDGIPDDLFFTDIGVGTSTESKKESKIQKNKKSSSTVLCHLCGKVIKNYGNSNKNHLNNHMKLHSDELQHKCTVKGCYRAYRWPGSLKLHEMSHNNGSNAKHSCSFCHKIFAFAYLLKKHLKEIHSDKIHECEKCGEVFLEEEEHDSHTKNCNKIKKSIIKEFISTREVITTLTVFNDKFHRRIFKYY